MNTTILTRRSANLATAANIQLQYGEPLYTDDQYFTIGNGNESLVSQLPVLRFVPRVQADSQLYYTVNSDGKIQLNTSNGSTLTPILTFGDAASRDVSTSAIQGSSNLITSGAVKQIQTDLSNSINTLNTALETLRDNISDFSGKDLDTTVTQDSSNPVTAGAVYQFVTQAITAAFDSYVPWTTDSTQVKKFYLNPVDGVQYYNGSTWSTVRVGYT